MIVGLGEHGATRIDDDSSFIASTGGFRKADVVRRDGIADPDRVEAIRASRLDRRFGVTAACHGQHQDLGTF